LLIANRGEIAARIIRTCREMNISSVAVFSDADSERRYARMADQVVRVGTAPSQASYLNQDRIIEAAKKTGADAIHPGYGFLAENPEFAEKCAKAGLLFVGPSPAAMMTMASKIKARKLVRDLGIPVIPGYDGTSQILANFKDAASDIGFPVLLKAAAGGGGIGMRVIGAASELDEIFDSARQEAMNSFGDETLLLEKYLPKVRHIEVQVAADQYRNAVHMFERECSVQRRRQKIIEETPAPNLSDDCRRMLFAAAVKITQAVKYSGLGTVEFVVEANDDSTPKFYFLEMNTRLQVEHGITEQVTGLDLVRLQIEIAEGRTLPFSQEEITSKGHSIECRLYAEDSRQNFQPMTGRILHWAPPRLPNIRIEEATTSGDEVSVFYDPMLLKIIASGEDREAAIRSIDKALGDLVLLGLTTNQNFLRAVVQYPLWQAGKADTQFVESRLDELNERTLPDVKRLAIVATIHLAGQNSIPGAGSGWKGERHLTKTMELEINSDRVSITYKTTGRDSYQIDIGGIQIQAETISLEPIYESVSNTGAIELTMQESWIREKFVIAQEGNILFVHDKENGTHPVRQLVRDQIDRISTDSAYRSSMSARVIKLLVSPGEKVEAGQKLLLLESMKMEVVIKAQNAGTVSQVLVEENQLIEAETEMLVFE
ncbi:MAG: ATP-grasp domain-containing protein, partial [Proteobacteria bacterium]|nr:ATP-grasp domain-containing protein [Pseudomonadota bacterium]